MSTTTGIPIGQLPVLGAVTDDSYVVGEHAGSGLFSALALRSYGAGGNVGRNLVHNSLFNVQQRGPGPFTTSGGYTVDRWLLAFTGDTVSIVPASLSDANRTAIGDEAARFCLQATVTGVNAAGNSSMVMHRIEDVRRLSGKTVAVSFWATGSASTLKLGVAVDQNFGTGGSPSAAVNGAGQSVTLSTAWTRYSLTFTLPSTSGLTLGTNNDHNTQLDFWYSSGSTNNIRAGGIGVQSGTFQLWGIQLEAGSVATPLDNGGSPADQLSQCQRYYQVGAGTVGAYASSAGATHIWVTYPLPVTMRAAPACTITPTGGGNYTTVAINPPRTASLAINPTATVAGDVQFDYTFTASADL